MSDCETCDPCETDSPIVCEELQTIESPKRIIVEDESFCNGTIQEPNDISLLENIDGNLQWDSGSQSNQIFIPELQDHDINVVPKIIVIESDGTAKQWQPANSGNNFIANWNGSQFEIGTIGSFLPAGDGLYVKSGSSSSFINGINGQYLNIDSGAIQFQSINPGSQPSGSILCYGGTVAPSGYFICDGSAIDRTLYSTLFGIIGIIYGAGDGITTFNIPDLRGIFIRGLDSGSGIDPARTIGSQQAHAFQQHNHSGTTQPESNHTHTISGNTNNQSNDHKHQLSSNITIISPSTPTALNYIAKEYNNGTNYSNYYLFSGTSTSATLGKTSNTNTNHIHNYNGSSSAGTAHDHTISSYGQNETRPVNLALNWIIKT